MAAIDLLWRASPSSVAASTRSACVMAEAYGYRRIAFPVLGSGSGGLPVARALAAMQEAAIPALRQLDITIVRHVK